MFTNFKAVHHRHAAAHGLALLNLHGTDLAITEVIDIAREANPRMLSMRNGRSADIDVLVRMKTRIMKTKRSLDIGKPRLSQLPGNLHTVAIAITMRKNPGHRVTAITVIEAVTGTVTMMKNVATGRRNLGHPLQ